MKSASLIALAALALGAAPAVADNGQVFDHGAQLRAYSSVLPRDNARQCFNGAVITGANRSGDNTVYVQSTQGIYRLRLASDCDGLNAAEKINVRSSGSDIICPGEIADVIAKTAAGPRHCRVAEVRRLTSAEISALSAASRR
ncbi:hypothetical protein DDF62_15140 [Caulobacter radicis]|uniref:DUF6491 family protein n=1 Tax=Caulobacter radicis TaxID=2172650 RepID=UPI000D57D8A0|nr:DUF6491 family protein [Caulobacter radicis]PVM88114.1 hypothetical protein DDF62_15140 [Caulobacter radicis]